MLWKLLKSWMVVAYSYAQVRFSLIIDMSGTGTTVHELTVSQLYQLVLKEYNYLSMNYLRLHMEPFNRFRNVRSKI